MSPSPFDFKDPDLPKFWTDAYSRAKAIGDTNDKFLCQIGIPKFIRQFMYGLLVMFLFCFLGLIFMALSVTVYLTGIIARIVFAVIREAREDAADEINPLIAEVMSEFLSVEVQEGDLSSPKGKEGAVRQAASIGKKIYDILTQEFNASETVTPEQGEHAAHVFTGFSARFAVITAMISVLGETATLGAVENFRELGVDLAENLGLGRLQRRVLGTLIQNVVQKPYDSFLRNKYRPDSLTDVQFVKAYQSGRITEADMRRELGHKGYREAYIDELLAQLQLRLSDSEIEILLRFTNRQRDTLPVPSATGQPTLGDIPKLTTDDAVKILVTQGLSPELAKQRLVARSLARADNEVQSYITIVEGKLSDGVITQEQAADLIRSTPLSPEELHWRLAGIGLRLEYPRKKLTLAEVRTAFENGVIDLDYWDRFLDSEGYSDEDQLILLYQLLIDTKRFVDRQTAAAERLARKASTVKK